jgi:hypothetical protein
LSVSELYSKLKDIKSKTIVSEQSIAFTLAVQMSIGQINTENPRIIKVLKHLCLWPGGLISDELKTIAPYWDDWVSLLKDRSIITTFKVHYKNEKLSKCAQ